jgi:acetolactate synthase-1/2/3 large subunit
MTVRSGGQLVVDALAQHGADRVFCVPGESYLDVLDALHDSPINTIVCRHEGGAAYMAEANGKLSGRPGIAMVTRGPGAANAFVGVHTAYQDAVPMILFVGLIPLPHRHREAFQEFDIAGWFGTTAKQVLVLDAADRAPEIVAAAYHAAMSGRPGPVIVGLPEDVLVEEVEVPDVRPLPVPSGSVSAADIAALGTLLEQATAPLVVVGGSRWTAETSRKLARWAEDWELPVAGDFRAYDLIDHDSVSYVGQLGYGRDDRLAVDDVGQCGHRSSKGRCRIRV